MTLSTDKPMPEAEREFKIRRTMSGTVIVDVESVVRSRKFQEALQLGADIVEEDARYFESESAAGS